jgi:Bacterial membrane protein YfhO
MTAKPERPREKSGGQGAGGKRDARGKGSAQGSGRATRAPGAAGASIAVGGAARAAAANAWPTRILLASFLAPILLYFGSFLFSNTMIYGSDTVPMGYMARQLYRTMWQRFGEFPLWNPYILGGLPFVDALHGDIFYPTTILKFIMPLHRGMGMVLALHILLAGFFMYLCLRNEGLSKAASWFGGIAYMAGPYLVSLILAGHDGKIYVTALFPLAWLTLRRAEKCGRAGAYALFALVVGLLILTAHIQMAYFSMWALGLQFLTHLWEIRAERARLARSAALFAAACAIGVAIGAVQLYPSYVYTSQFGPRAGGLTYETSTSWSLHPEEIVSLWMPEFVSYRTPVGDTDGYWGRNPFKLNSESPGAIPFLLALAFLLFAKGARRRFIGFLAVGALVYALGANTPLFHLFYAAIPGVKLFRAPSIIAFLFHFCVAFLAAHAIERWVVARSALAAGEVKRVTILFAALGGVLVVFLLLGPGLAGVWRAIDPGLTGPKLQAFQRNAGNLRLGALLGLGAIALAAWVVRASLSQKLAVSTGVILLGAATLLLDWRVGRDFILVGPLETWIRSDRTIEFLRAQAERPPDGQPFRVLAVSQRYPDNYLPIFEIESPQGFHDNRVRTYDELVLKDPSGLGSAGMLELLDACYVVSDRALPPPFSQVFSDGETTVFENPGVLPRASLHRTVEVLDEAATLERMRSRDWRPRSTLFVTEAPDAAIDAAGDASADRVEVTRYTPNRIELSVNAASPAMLLVTNNYLPYWKAAIDGAPAKVVRADYSFQAVALPSGSHNVTLAFHSEPLARASVATAIGLVVALATLVADALARKHARSRRADTVAESPSTTRESGSLRGIDGGVVHQASIGARLDDVPIDSPRRAAEPRSEASPS